MIHVVAEKATPRVPAEGRNEHEHHLDSSTTCAFCGEGQDVRPPPNGRQRGFVCGEGQDVYQMGDKWICVDHIGLVVSLAANDLFSGDVHYTKAFETAVLM